MGQEEEDPPKITINNYELEAVQDYTYLGSTISANLSLDAEIIKDGARFFEDGEKMQLSYAVRNTHRTIGTRASSHLVRKFGMRNNLQPDHLTLKLSASQCG